jgi:hypothetical protein
LLGCRTNERLGRALNSPPEPSTAPCLSLPLSLPAPSLTHTDVEAERRYQEKRAAEKAGEPIPPPPVVLWRSPRELGVWLKDLRRARVAGSLAGAAYATAALIDRAHVSGRRVCACVSGRCVWVGGCVCVGGCVSGGAGLGLVAERCTASTPPPAQPTRCLQFA